MRAFLGLLVVCFLIGCDSAPSKAQAELPTAPLILTRNDGSTDTFIVELALTEKQQKIGLMYRKTMPQQHGMLFIFSRDDISMWMKNTYIPLDMVFTNSQGRVVDILRNTAPLSETILSPKVPANVVLELNAGTVGRTNINIGDTLKVDGYLPAP
ncbi:MAG: DUF192 domain-containing protein [Alphaproteobacteria bacterium]|nr:DUF192 domain-containing protein [Alphaproteobacteria bacterium]